MATAPTASASTVGNWGCSAKDGGRLCIQVVSDGYRVSFDNQTMVTKRLDFNLVWGGNPSHGTLTGDQGSFWSVPGATNSYIFKIGVKDWAWPLLRDLSTGSTYSGPTV
ncbi:hypothetical protein [Kitasatospora indigofera]|uniref:hypothetical protein n=1 Tax=Kitasatospora indigofera TaxID=67307 RepID=UPI0033BB3962